MKSGYVKYIACVIAFLLIGLYDVKDNFKGLYGNVALLLLLLGAIVGSFIQHRRSAGWKLFAAGLLGFIFSTVIGSQFDRAVKRSAAAVVASIYDYQQRTGAFPESLMQVASADNIKDLSRKRIKYGSRVFYERTVDGFTLFYDTYAFNGQRWDIEKKTFVETLD